MSITEPLLNINKKADSMPDEAKPRRHQPQGCYPGKSKLYVAATAAYLGSIAMGCVLGYSSPALHDLEPVSAKIHPSDKEGSWVGSIMTIGALVGGILAGPVIDLFGRKTVLIFSVIPFTGGWFCIAYANSLLPLLIGRLITGFCCGLISLTVPVYLAEISTPERRGLLGSGFQLNCVFGILITYVIGGYVSWINLALISAVPPILMSAMMVVMPESPRWLIAKKRKMEATDAIFFLNGNNVDPEESCHELQENFQQQAQGKVSFNELLQPQIVKPMLLCLALMLFQQWSGINGIMFYASQIFKNSGFSSIDPAICSIILGAAQVVGTFVGTMIIDKAGRKVLLILSGGFMAFGLTTLSILLGIASTKDKEFMDQNGWISVASLSIYVFAFAIGYGPIPWLMMSELLPDRVKGMASGVATCFNWTNAFLVTNQFNNMISGMNSFGAYIFFDIVSIISCIFVFFFLPETKGKSLDDIERLFIGSNDSNEVVL